jgi:hypothetical protein
VLTKARRREIHGGGQDLIEAQRALQLQDRNARDGTPMSDESSDLPLDEFRSFLERTSLSEEDKMFVLASYWSLSEFPPVQSAHDLERYRRIEEAIASPSASDNQETFLAWTRSQGGKVAAAVGARILEWEETRQEDV